MAVLSLFKKVTAVFIALFWCIGIGKTNVSEFSALDGENIRLNLTVFSDLHVESNNYSRRETIIKCLNSLNGSTDTIDALVMPGDNTMNGQIIENMLLYGTLETQCPVKPYLPCPGNHDVNSESTNNNYLSYFNAFVGDATENGCYYKVINGYYLIFLAGSDTDWNSRSFTDGQLDWLEATLATAAESEKPIFVINHFPSSHIVEGRSRYRSLLSSYPNTFAIVGHMHYYFNDVTIDGNYTAHELWIPSLSMTDGDIGTGLGAQLEVYDDEVVLRYRNYLSQEWEHDVRFSFNDIYLPVIA